MTMRSIAIGGVLIGLGFTVGIASSTLATSNSEQYEGVEVPDGYAVGQSVVDNGPAMPVAEPQITAAAEPISEPVSNSIVKQEPQEKEVVPSCNVK